MCDEYGVRGFNGHNSLSITYKLEVQIPLLLHMYHEDYVAYIALLVYYNSIQYKRIEVYTSNNPMAALSEFKPNYYDLLLVDINMPNMNGFELSERILATDINVKVCFMSCAAEINYEALREIYPISLGCIIRKPVSIDYLVKLIRSELD
jgi:two-component SAPR family response regulator